MGRYRSVPQTSSRVRYEMLLSLYTYGICGPLKLSVDKASNLNTVYMSCFMTGRFSAIFVSRFVSPKKMIFTSLTMCIVAATILCIFAASSEIGLFIGTGIMGFG